jgi:hypothetical protein
MKGSIRQRSPGSWELTVDLGRDALGQRQRRFLTVRGTKAQAQRKLRELLSTLDKGLALPGGKILLRDWLDRWLAERITPNRRQGTKERYRDIAEKHLKPHIGHLEPGHVQALEAKLTAGACPSAGSNWSTPSYPGPLNTPCRWS